ncbi:MULTISPECIES: mycofactocin-coupled SDR family oxidoreductase [Halolamina]|uniref:SDR family mycofactocin-dependent oxidoreductase n=1 Tax=Halolamina pelagica TaxID=699431 RepID=A0A1I5T5J3_9EURY|nr:MULTISPECIES: mycofactocin-coupled SDR family oxidoreductase [Halolamina]NHX37475.1 mycofactocin-coupled SDR family oxidoreductase [Halolamina sp. R1-12]SFP77937.1 SDR family mycofactocin-dependent oxidoreductase [Halolamina pelagica]
MVSYDFSGKVAFVTGAARGQGRSHAQHYAKHGADVVVTDIGSSDVESVPYDLGTSEELEETTQLVEDEGQEALAIEMDVRNEDEVEAAVTEAVDHFGRIDILANNAAVVTVSDLVELDEEMWDQLLDTNLKGVWLCSKHVGQHFVERGDGGKIVSTSSQAGMTGNPGIGHYVASKWGVRGLTKTLALELAEYDVNVNAVVPSVVNTPMITGLTEAYGEEALGSIGEVAGPMNIFTPDNPGIDPGDISEAYMWLSSDAARYVTGITLPVDTGHTIK